MAITMADIMLVDIGVEQRIETFIDLGEYADVPGI